MSNKTNKSSRPTKRPANFRSSYRHKSWFKPWMGWSIGIALVGTAAIIIFVSRSQPVVSNISGVTAFGSLSRSHISQAVKYPLAPPVGGDHSAVWQNCGIYDKPVPDENAVHSMEHGAVWVAYKADLPADGVEQLRSLARGHNYLLLSPYQGLSAPVVASAWGLQLKLDTRTDPRLSQFIARYENGSQTPEPGTLCSGGQGSPVER